MEGGADGGGGWEWWGVYVCVCVFKHQQSQPLKSSSSFTAKTWCMMGTARARIDKSLAAMRISLPIFRVFFFPVTPLERLRRPLSIQLYLYAASAALKAVSEGRKPLVHTRGGEGGGWVGGGLLPGKGGQKEERSICTPANVQYLQTEDRELPDPPQVLASPSCSCHLSGPQVKST